MRPHSCTRSSTRRPASSSPPLSSTKARIHHRPRPRAPFPKCKPQAASRASGSWLGLARLLPQAQAIPRLSGAEEMRRARPRYDVHDGEWRIGERQRASDESCPVQRGCVKRGGAR
ncbi:hypothetical protein B0H13DRAFT_2659863 [Mycena leptocephala]|nr:hypothetical protein B0H13DRAFT_2659863 [Mycena leptocephala]